MVESRDRLPAGYWRLWWASAVNNVGDGAFLVAVPLLAARTSASPVLVSAVSAAAFLPWLLFSLPVGAVVDRRDRTRLMVRSQLAEAAVVAVTAVLVAAGGSSVALLVSMAFALGACEVVFTNAAQAMLPEIVPGALLHRANGYQNTVSYVGRQFAGPPLGSVLFAVAAAAPFGLDAVSFVGSAALLATLSRRPRRVVEHPPMRAAIGEGLRWLFGHRLLRTLAVLLGVNTFCFSMGASTLVLLATRTLHVGTRGYGLLLAAAAVGGTVGGMVNDRLLARLGALPALVLSLTTTAAAFLAAGVAPDGAVLAALLGISGFAVTIWNVLALSLRQQLVPDELRGRVNSVYRMIGWGLMPLGALAGGLVAGTLGLRAPYPVAGAIRVVALLVALPTLVATLRPTTPRAGEDAREPRGCDSALSVAGAGIGPMATSARDGIPVRLRAGDWAFIDATMDNEASDWITEDDGQERAAAALAIREAGWDQVPWVDGTWPPLDQVITITLTRDQWLFAIAAVKEHDPSLEAIGDREGLEAGRAVLQVLTAQVTRT